MRLFVAVSGIALALAAAVGAAAAAQTRTPLPLPSPSATPSPSPSPPAAPAGVIPASATLTVTGAPLEPDVLEREVQAALDRLIRPTLQPGASIAYGPIVPAPPALPPDYITTVVVPVTIGGVGDFAPVTGTTTVDLTNLALEPPVPSLLFFDDDPEYVSEVGVLSRYTVDAGTARLYYYHDDLGLPKDIAVIVSAASATPSRVQLIDVDAGPNLDVMSVGDEVSRDFVQEQLGDEGIVADVAPGSPILVHDALTLAGELVAGAIDVRVLMGGPVTLTVVASPAGEDPLAYLGAPYVARDGKNRHGAFDVAGFGLETLAYDVGGPDAAYVFGGDGDDPPSPPNVDPFDPGRDRGDYGVVQQLTFDIANPLDDPAPVYLYEEPRGGVVRSNFLVDGVLEQLGCARLPERYLIATYEIPAHQRLVSTVLTMADGGSNFPLEVGVTQTPPLPATPPQDAPDGCFPKPQLSPSASPSASAPPTGSP